MRLVIISLILSALLGCGVEIIEKPSKDVKTMTVNGVMHISVPTSNVLLRYHDLRPCSKALGEYRAICSNGGYKYGWKE